jgi:DNA repair protein SbcD/Mre11
MEAQRMIKILLTSDIHLGAESSSIPIRTSDRLMTLKKITTLAKDHDLLLIAGDLFDSHTPDATLVADVSRLFTYLKKQDTTILLSPGEHECESASLPPFFKELDAHRVFESASDAPYEFIKETQKIFIYGAPAYVHTDLSKVGKIKKEGFHIGLFHTDIGNSRNAGDSSSSLTISDMKSLELDFYALGHNHFFKLYKYQNEIIGAYPGSPEASDASECGDRYVLSLTVSGDEITQIKRLTVNSVTILSSDFDCSQNSAFQLTELLEKNASPKTAYTLTLTGMRAYPIPWERIKAYSERYYRLDVLDESELSLLELIDDYSSENSMRGDYFKILKEHISNGTFDADPRQMSRILSLVINNEKPVPEDWLCALIHA